MLKWVALVLGCLTSQIAAADETTLITAAQLREAIYNRQVDRVETRLDAAQQAFEAGEISAYDMRALFSIFAVTHPDVISFVEGWRDAHPGSPYAKVAQAWVYYRAGWIVRGQKPARRTHPEAMEKHYLLHHDSLELALEAYESNPKLIPASDAIILLGNTGGNRQKSFDVFDQTMQDAPNWGTIERAFTFTHPGYGGSYEMGQAICEHYAPMAEHERNNLTRYCQIAFLVQRNPVNEWPKLALSLLDEESDPSLGQLEFIARLNNHPQSREDAEYLRGYSDEHGFDTLRRARYYDDYVAKRHGFAPKYHEMLELEKTRAEDALAHDPYSPELLDILSQRSTHVTRTENGWSYSPVQNSPSPEQELDLLLRRVVIAPYNPEQWDRLASAMETRSRLSHREGADLIRWDDLYGNAVYYSQHAPEYLETFLRKKVTQLMLIRKVREEGVKFNGWDIALLNIDETDDIICPIIRAGRLLEAVRLGESANNAFAEGYQPVIDVLTREAAQTGDCKHVLNAEIEALAFAPTVMGLGALRTFVADTTSTE
ncbi:hypothetical protein RA19_23265 [Leisingera sp. ANG-M1]|uniref:DUF4034 domain-containing protein n=1 Tax=Leisingera sp. ANG-M1 TaxID=1577895 RepID=UPI00057EADF5|nr:DUF4034 domain-containing protein [Leisingera sp. ANG-M1]KIC07699.1 hypothetical protein RA19_23265 [Leisingera sp. ANG-M1]